MNKPSLMRRIVGRENMPSYPQIKLGEYLVSVAPSDMERKFIKSTPFYNGTDIWFDLNISKTYERKHGLERVPKIDEIVCYEWELYDRDADKIIIPPVQDKLNIHNSKGKKRSGIKISWQTDLKGIYFTGYKTIHVGRLWEFHRYDLRLKESGSDKEKEIVAEFMLLNIDEHGENFHTMIWTLLAGALISFLVALATTLFFGR